MITNSVDERRGGARQVVVSESELLSRAGHEVTVIHGQGSASAHRMGRASVCHIPDLQLMPGPKAGQRGVAGTTLTENPDVVHFHLSDPSGHDKMIAWVSSRFPSVYTVHNHHLSCLNMFRWLPRDSTPCPLKSGALWCYPYACLYKCVSRQPNRFLRALLEYSQRRKAVQGIQDLLSYQAICGKHLLMPVFQPRR